MNENIKYTITPEQLLQEQGVKYSIKGNWLSVKVCPFCQGGKSGQQYTFGVHRFDYNYNCLRTTCGNSSSFWNLLVHFGYDPKQYVDYKQSNGYAKKAKTTKFIYRRQQ